MSYLFGGEPTQSRQDTLNDLGSAQFSEEDLAPKISDSLTPENIGLAVPRIATRAVADLGIAASPIASTVPMAIDRAFDTNTTDWWHRHVTQSLISTSQQLTPDPQTTHTALQVADQFAGMAGKLLLTRGNPFAFSGESFLERTVKEIDKGKDTATAAQLGAVEGYTNLLGTALPGGFVSQAFKAPLRVQGAVSGAALNVGLGMGQREASKQILTDSGHEAEAQQNSWHDGWGIALDAAFGSLAGSFAPGTHQTTPSHVDALLTANDAHAIAHPDGLHATTPEANVALTDNMSAAVHALVNDEPVISTIHDAEPFAHDSQKGDVEQQIASHIADIHNENIQQAVNDFGETYPDIFNKIVESNYKEQIATISDNAGWTQRGGEIVRNTDGEVVDRTSWLPREEWFGRFVSEGMGNQASLKKTVNKYISGETLGPKQRAAIEWLKAEVDGYNQDGNPDNFTVTDARADLNNRLIEKINAIHEQRAHDKSVNKLLETAKKHDAELGTDFHSILEREKSALTADEISAWNQDLADHRLDNQPHVTAENNTIVDTPEVAAARAIDTGDHVFEIDHDDGSKTTGTAAEIMNQLDEEMAFAEQSEAATQAAINCFLTWGDV